MKIGLNIRPNDEVYIFVYDKDYIYLPSVSRIYGSDFRKISNVSIIDNHAKPVDNIIFIRYERLRTNMVIINIMK